MDLSIAQEHVRAFLEQMGHNVDRDGLKETPARFVKAFVELTAPSGPSPEMLLSKVFKDAGDVDQMVAVGPVSFTSMCEHHLLPFTGTAYIAYLPSAGRVVGLSKLPRLVAWHAAGLQMQERMTRAICDDITTYLEPAGAAVIVDAVHSCMAIRGVKASGASMRTSALTGPFRDDPSARAELFALAK